MTYSIRDGIGHWKGNSLSPEPCALSPAELRLHANLTVGTQTTGISRPNVDTVGMPIEHLDFEPPCDSRRRLAHLVDSLPPATHQWRKGCCGLLRLSCWSCVVKVLSSSPGTCPDCGFLFYDMADYVTDLRSLR